MNREQGIGFTDYVKSIWQDWKPSDEEVSLWCRQFSAYDTDIARQAAGEHKATGTGGFKTPKLDKILALAKDLQQSKHYHEHKDESNEPCIIYSIKCRSHPGIPHYVGQKRDFYINNAKNLNSIPYDRVSREAAEAVKAFARIYGGEWVIVWGQGFQSDIPF